MANAPTRESGVECAPDGEDTSSVIEGIGEVRRAACHPWSVGVARFGYTARGAIYLLIGLLAMQTAVGARRTAADPVAVFHALASNTPGRVALVVLGVGLIVYALWHAVQTVVDTQGVDRGALRVLERVAWAGLFLIYTGLGYTALRLVGSGGGEPDTDLPLRAWVAWLVGLPLGDVLVGVVGVGFWGAAGFFLYQAATGHFRATLALLDAPRAVRRWAMALGRIGYAALALVNALVGRYLFAAAWRRDPGEARGIGGALTALAGWTPGPPLLGALATGLIAYGAFNLMEARYRRLVRPE